MDLVSEIRASQVQFLIQSLSGFVVWACCLSIISFSLTLPVKGESNYYPLHRTVVRIR